MATHKKAEEAAEVKTGAESAQDDVERMDVEKITPAEESAAVEAIEAPQDMEKPKLWEGYSQFVYIGPSLPGGLLKKNAVLVGEFEQITDYLTPVLEQYPQAERLLYPVEKAGYAMKKAQVQGNIIHKYYEDLVSLTNAHMKEE